MQFGGERKINSTNGVRPTGYTHAEINLDPILILKIYKIIICQDGSWSEPN